MDGISDAMVEKYDYNFEPLIRKVGEECIIRPERNGVTLYDNTTDQYIFYSSLKFNQLSNIKSSFELRKFLTSYAGCISKSIDYSAPFRGNWLLETRCNLDCIYCFADDKMQTRHLFKNFDHSTTIHLLKRLNVMNVGITGGEPTLNPDLANIVSRISEFATVNIDTNGTIECFDESFVKMLKLQNVLVRISVDSFDEDLAKRVRLFKKKDYSYETLERNISYLIQNGVNVLVHNVVTSYNIDDLYGVAQELIKLHVKRWHIYGVHKSSKCADFYEQIRVSAIELESTVQKLKQLFSDKIHISMFLDDKKYSENSILFVDHLGRLFVDSVQRGVRFIDTSNVNPILAVANSLNIKAHCNDYLTLERIIRD